MRTLLVASAGGHLLELHRLRPRLLPVADDVVWVTADTPQTRSLLQGEEVITLPNVAPRGYRAAAANAAAARGILRRSRVDRVVSTGAGIALSFLPMARLHGIEAHYIESAARTEGPSMTGSALRRLRAAHLYTQHAAWAKAPWEHRGSVFDDVVVGNRAAEGKVRRVLVSCGTMTFPFDRLVRRLATVVPADAEVTWQLAFTPAVDLPGTVVRSVGHDELVSAMAAADVVVSHAGVGTALTALSVGRCPVLVPRLARHGEHADDHQVQIAEMLTARGLAVFADADEVALGDLEQAAALEAHVRPEVPAFPLRGMTALLAPVAGASR